MKYDKIKMVGDSTNVRYLLKKVGKKVLVVIGVNPSTATDVKSDATMTKVMGFAERNGFDGFLMLNLYPQRATNPGCLDKEKNVELHNENIKQITMEIARLESQTVLLAFGDTIEVRPWLKDCLKEIVALFDQKNAKWVQIGGSTKAGNPRHPSRAAYSLFCDFDMTNYLK